MTKAKAVAVPEEVTYIIEGKTYDVDIIRGVLFSTVDEDGEEHMFCFEGLCGHGITWERVE